MDSKPRVGFVGLGAMGTRMAKRIGDAGYRLAVWNRSPGPTAGFADVAASPVALAGRCDVVISMLLDDDVVRQTIGPVLAAGRAGLTVIEMSTIDPATSRELHAAAAATGVDYLDAPVSGSTPQAEQGQLVVLVGGDRAVFERVKPVLLAMGKSAEHLGGPGAGSTAKLAINAVVIGAVQVLAEGLALAERGGLGRKQFLDVIGQTSVISPAQRSKFALVERDEFPPMFACATAAKDLRLVAALAERVGLAMPAAAAARASLDAAKADHGAEDFSIILRTIAGR